MAHELIPVLDYAENNHDVNLLKEVAYFSRGVSIQKDPQTGLRKGMTLLPAVLCHSVFKNEEFWNKYDRRLASILQKENIDISNSWTKSSYALLSGDIKFLKVISNVESNPKLLDEPAEMESNLLLKLLSKYNRKAVSTQSSETQLKSIDSLKQSSTSLSNLEKEQNEQLNRLIQDYIRLS